MKTVNEILENFCVQLIEHGYSMPKEVVFDPETLGKYNQQVQSNWNAQENGTDVVNHTVSGYVGVITLSSRK